MQYNQNYYQKYQKMQLLKKNYKNLKQEVYEELKKCRRKHSAIESKEIYLGLLKRKLLMNMVYIGEMSITGKWE